MREITITIILRGDSIRRGIKLFCMVLLLIVSPECTTQMSTDDFETSIQDYLPKIDEDDIFQVDILPPKLEDHIDIIDNELVSELGILPVAQWYEYSVIPEECMQIEDSYTEVVRLQHSGEIFDADTKVLLHFDYLASKKQWIYKSAEIPEDAQWPLFSCNIEGIWSPEGVRTQVLFPYEQYEINLEILIQNYEATDQSGSVLGQFDWVASNLETSSLHGTDILR